MVAAKNNEILLAWDPPEDSYNNDMMNSQLQLPRQYEVRYFENTMNNMNMNIKTSTAERNSSSATTLIVNNKEEVSIGNLKHKTEYTFQVGVFSMKHNGFCLKLL